MSADAQALVRQLTENPEVLERMQNMIALLRATPPQSSTAGGSGGSGRSNSSRDNGGSGGRDAARRAQLSRVTRPPRTGYDADLDAGRHRSPHTSTLSSSDGAGRGAVSPPATVLTRGAPHAVHSTSSPSPSFADTAVSTRRPMRDHPPSAAAAADATDPGRGEAQRTVLAEAQRRIVELERELQRTTHRVDQLSDVVQRQKEELQVAHDRHTLEMEEARHAYAAVMHRKDEVQEETLRQLLKSRQLMVSAAKYEAAVTAATSSTSTTAVAAGAARYRAQRSAKENSGHLGASDGVAAMKGHHDGGSGGGGSEGLSPRHTSVNAQRPSARGYASGSGVAKLKRERQHDSDSDGDGYGVGESRGDAAEQPPPSGRRTAAGVWDRRGSDDRGAPGRLREAVVSKAETSPAYITAATPAGKTSTTLTSARTQSRSTRKRRTPRTPSLTNADRLAGSSAAARSAAPAAPQFLPGTASLKLDSPTPVVSTAWTTGRSITSSRTPPSHAAPKHHYVREQVPQHAAPPPPSTTLPRQPLTLRAAGRLPPAPAPPPTAAAAAAAATGVRHPRSGTSSIASGGPTRSPSPVNPKRGAVLQRRFIFTGLKDDEPQRLASAIAAVGDGAAALASDLDEPPPSSATHIVLRGTPRSVKALCGVVSGKWLVSPEYVFNSEQSGFWLDELEEGGLRIFPPPLRCQRFLLTIEHPSIRAKLAQVIEYGGGEVLPFSGGGGADKRLNNNSSGSSGSGGTLAQDVIVITSGDDLLRYATQERL
ncbi:kinetoplastid kinetochore protein 4 [Novymonas esmeraldas]|uniref:Kinetoplastid kinetochore protein 4 n=1 Tax=Novymonas esmeraldas TaxID=1808958 RepID=A0AAW0EQM3_9TRYP